MKNSVSFMPSAQITRELLPKLLIHFSLQHYSIEKTCPLYIYSFREAILEITPTAI